MLYVERPSFQTLNPTTSSTMGPSWHTGNCAITCLFCLWQYAAVSWIVYSILFWGEWLKSHLNNSELCKMYEYALLFLKLRNGWKKWFSINFSLQLNKCLWYNKSAWLLFLAYMSPSPFQDVMQHSETSSICFWIIHAKYMLLVFWRLLLK